MLSSSQNSYGESQYGPGYGHAGTAYLPQPSAYAPRAYSTTTSYQGHAYGPPYREQQPEPKEKKYRCGDNPQDHGCGKAFDTLSNKNRHSREALKMSPVYLCTKCGKEFTRNHARAQHELKNTCEKVKRERERSFNQP